VDHWLVIATHQGVGRGDRCAVMTGSAVVGGCGGHTVQF
jgi:hypothetical protein